MSKRSVRKNRHYKTTLSFKERVHIGNERAKEKSAVPEHAEHVHGENCNH